MPNNTQFFGTGGSAITALQTPRLFKLQRDFSDWVAGMASSYKGGHSIPARDQCAGLIDCNRGHECPPYDNAARVQQW